MLEGVGMGEVGPSEVNDVLEKEGGPGEVLEKEGGG